MSQYKEKKSVIFWSKFTLMTTKRQSHFWRILLFLSKTNLLILDLININSLFKIVTREVVTSLSTVKFLYKMLSAKLCISEIKWWMLAFLIPTQDYSEEVASLIFLLFRWCFLFDLFESLGIINYAFPAKSFN